MSTHYKNHDFYVDLFNQVNHVQKGQEFSSYKALCNYLDLSVSTGKQRELDKRHLQCFFEWSKLPNSNRLIVTDTFYDNPKEYNDQRNGIHTTPLNQMMQNMLLCHSWPEVFYTKRKILNTLELIPKNDILGLHTPAFWNYSRKQYDLLVSAIHQLNKKGLADISPVIISPGNVIFSTDTGPFDSLCRSVLRDYGVNCIPEIYRFGLQESFWQSLDTAAQDKFGVAYLKKVLRMRTLDCQEAHPVDRNQYLDMILGKMLQTPSAKKRQHAIGTQSYESYRKELTHVISAITATT